MKRRGRQKSSPSTAATPRASTRAKAKRRVSWKVRALVAMLTCGLLGTIVLSVAFIYYTLRFPDLGTLRQRERAPVVRVLASDGTLLAERGAAYDFMPFDLLPKHIVNAVVATEDRRFFTHHGLDPIGLMRAVFANLRAGRYAQGGSTLTQQLAKNLFLSSERSLRRKIEELIIALWLEARLSKEDIIELYLNRVYFGGGAYGIEAAAQRYFDKSARALSLGEAAVLAGVLKAPSRYSPAASASLARMRSRLVLKRMLADGLITAADELKALRHPVRFADRKPERGPTGYEYAVDYVLERLPQLIGLGSTEVIVETTIDAGLQRQAQAVVQRALAGEGRGLNAGQAAVVVMDSGGGIRALIGGRAWADSQFNRATKALRQPGSAFKPIVYLAAVEQGAKPDTIVNDAPITIGGWSPRNDNGQFQGATTLRQSLANSINTVAVRLQQQAGTDRVIALARRLGLRSELRDSPSLALGTSEVSLLELAGSYAVLASAGSSVTPYIVRKVRASNGAVLYKPPARVQRSIVTPEHAALVTEMLNAALVSGTGRRAAFPHHQAAGKTGTTQEFRDAWFIGYTAHMTAGVWVGNDDATPMRHVTGGGLPARIWRDVMMPAHDGLPTLSLHGVPSAPQHSAGAAVVTGTPAQR